MDSILVHVQGSVLYVQSAYSSSLTKVSISGSTDIFNSFAGLRLGSIFWQIILDSTIKIKSTQFMA